MVGSAPMPIPLTELRKPLLADRILDLLRKDPTQAYSLLEILAAMLGVPAAEISTSSWPEERRLTLVDPVLNALHQLVSEGRIEEVERSDDFYFFVPEEA